MRNRPRVWWTGWTEALLRPESITRTETDAGAELSRVTHPHSALVGSYVVVGNSPAIGEVDPTYPRGKFVAVSRSRAGGRCVEHDEASRCRPSEWRGQLARRQSWTGGPARGDVRPSGRSGVRCAGRAGRTGGRRAFAGLGCGAGDLLMVRAGFVQHLVANGRRHSVSLKANVHDAVRRRRAGDWRRWAWTHRADCPGLGCGCPVGAVRWATRGKSDAGDRIYATFLWGVQSILGAGTERAVRALVYTSRSDQELEGWFCGRCGNYGLEYVHCSKWIGGFCRLAGTRAKLGGWLEKSAQKSARIYVFLFEREELEKLERLVAIGLEYENTSETFFRTDFSKVQVLNSLIVSGL